MHAPDIDVVRALDTATGFRAADTDDGSIGLLTGRFSVFNTWYEIDSFWEGTFLERIAPGAFTDTITNDLANMRVLFDHGFDPQIGNKVLGPIRSLVEDKKGAAYEVPLFDTTYNRDLEPGLREGVYGASFRFRVQEEEWNDEPKPSKANPKGMPERTITKARVMEFGPVTFPANPAATAGLRSLTDSYYDRLRQRDTSAYQAAARAAGRLPATPVPDGHPPNVDVRPTDLTGRSDARSTDGGDPDTEPETGEVSPVNDDADDRRRQAQRRHLALRMRGIVR